LGGKHGVLTRAPRILVVAGQLVGEAVATALNVAGLQAQHAPLSALREPRSPFAEQDVVMLMYDTGAEDIAIAPGELPSANVVAVARAAHVAMVAATFEHDSPSSRLRGLATLGCPLNEVVGVLNRVAAGERACTPLAGGILLEARARPAAQSFDHERLTRREREIAELIRAGLSNKEIAASLFVSLSTVKAHVHAVLGKTGMRTRHELARSSEFERPRAVELDPHPAPN
jgi:DNA-binding CsgD family transcriptional regulator